MAEVWLLTLQITLLAFVICTVTAILICGIRIVLRKLARGKGAGK